MDTKNQNEENTQDSQSYQGDNSDDQAVLTILMHNVRGIRPASTGDDLVFDDDISYS